MTFIVYIYSLGRQRSLGFAILVYNTFKFPGAVKSILSVKIMKMRTVKLTPKFLIEALQGKATSFASNLPNDIQLLDIKFDLTSNRVVAIIRSDSFEDIPETYPIPELTLAYTTRTPTAPQPAANVSKPETRITVAFKPESVAVKKTQTQPSQQASKIENEFSPEQRKLLSFKVEGENVIVKPIQFLKAEWEDINEVVRSLGGKWVKGDIISYCAIPQQQT